MTLSALGVTAVYAGSGSSGPFPLQDDVANPILFENNSEIIVQKFINPDDSHPALLTGGVDYVLAGAGSPSAGSIMLSAPLAAGQTLLIRRVTAAIQTLDLTYGGDLSLENLEDTLDKHMRLIQELREETGRSLLFSGTTPSLTGSQTRTVPTPHPNYLLGWNSAANRLINVYPGDIDPFAVFITPFMQTLLDDADAIEARTTLGAQAAGAGSSRRFAVIPGRDGDDGERGPPARRGASGSDTFIQAGTGAVTRTQQNKLRELAIAVTDFGADPTGVADSLAAFNLWKAQITAGKTGRIPAGTYSFSAPFTFPLASNISIFGEGSGSTTLLYAGANTTNDCFIYGDGTNPYINVNLSGFTVRSSTIMTGGVGFRLRKFCRSSIFDVVIDGQDGNGRFFNGIHFDQVDNVYYTSFEARASNTGVLVNGGTGSVPKADLYLSQCKIASCALGLHIGGAFGGIYIDNFGLIANDVNLRINTSLVAEVNREIFIGLGAIDVADTGPSVHINQSLAGSALIQFADTWIASSAGIGVHIENANGCRIQIAGGTIFNHIGDGIRVDDASTVVLIEGNIIRNNGGFGINPNVSGHDVHVGLNTFISNTSGDIATGHQPASFPIQWRAHFLGTTAADNAAAACIGEVITATLAEGSAVSLTNGVSANVTSVSLTAGDWEVRGQVWWNLAATTTIAAEAVALHTVSATFPANNTPGFVLHRRPLQLMGDDCSIEIPPVRFNLSATTTVFLVVNLGFGASTAGAYGNIQARRIR